MKKPLFIIVGFVLLLGVIAYFFVQRHNGFYARAKHYADIAQLEQGIANMHEISENLLVQVKKQTERRGNLPEDLASIKRGEEVKRATSKTIQVLSRLVNTSGNIYKSCDLSMPSEKETVLSALQSHIQFVKMHYPKHLTFLEGIIDDDYLQTKTVAEARFVLLDFEWRLAQCEQSIMKSFLQNTDKQKIIPVLQSKKRTYYEGETYEASLRLLYPVQASAGKLKATCNGQPLPIDSNGVARVRLPTGKAGVYKWEGSFTYPFQGRDTTVRITQPYRVLPAQKP